MSIKKKIRDLKTDEVEFEIYLVEPEKQDKFNLSYVLAVPKNMKNDIKLIVETNNKEKGNKGRILDYATKTDKEILIENAIKQVIGNQIGSGRIEFAKKVGAPLMMPIIPAVKSRVPYYQQLSRECFTIDNPNDEFYRIDEQVCNMIKDAQKTIAEKGTKVAEKVFLNGYSTSGVFAQRFAFLHPEIIDTALIGGAGGSIPIPTDIRKSDELEYPLGTKDYKKLTGKDFNLESYRKINFQYYLSEFEEVRKSKKRKNELGFKAPMHDMSYMERSIPKDEGENYRKTFGIILWRKFIKVISEYEKAGYKIKTEMYRNKLHPNGIIPVDEFKNIYNRNGFTKNAKQLRKAKRRKMLDAIKMGIKILQKKSRKKLLLENKEQKSTYSEKVEEIDDIDLAKKIESSIKIKGIDDKIKSLRRKYKTQNSEGIYNYPLQTKLTSEQVIELTKSFFKSINTDLSNKVNDILSGKTRNDNEQFIDLQIYPYSENLKYYQTRYDTNSKNYGIRRRQAMAEMPNINSNDMIIYVPEKGDLRDLYALVHEISHSFDSQNGDTDTRKVLGEVIPQCMERMLDIFLLEMPKSEKIKYGIDDEKLKQDIQDRKITTFISRYDNTLQLNKNQGNRVKNSRYMLAQLYQTQFMKLSQKERKTAIAQFTKKIIQNDFEGANKVLEINIERSNFLQRDMYINDMIEEFNKLITPANGDSITKDTLRQPIIEQDLEK